MIDVHHRRVSLATTLGRPAGPRALALLLCLTLLALLPAARPALAQSALREQMFVLNQATEGLPYEAQIANPGGTTPPFRIELLTGEKPAGLEFTTDGKLAGRAARNTPRARPYIFKVRVMDSSDPRRVAEHWLSITVAPLPLIAPGGDPVPLPAATPTREEIEAEKARRRAEFVLTTATSDEETIALSQEFVTAPPSPSFDVDTAQSNLNALRAIIRDSIGTGTQNFQPGDYCMIHLILWKPLNGEKSEPDREIWALFKSRVPTTADTGVNPNTDIVWEPLPDPKNDEVFTTRIFGRKRVAVLLAHLNTPGTWDVKYKVSVNQKVPTPIQHVLDLAANITGGVSAVDDKGLTTKNIWGARMMLIKYESSELVVKVNAVTSGKDGRPVEQSKEHTNTFVNEGKYHWDVSVGLPVKSVRELHYKSEGGRVTADSKEKQSVYGFLDIYPWAVDLKGDSYLTKPHFVFGVPLGSKPLHRPFVGIGSGVFKSPIKFNFFAGIVFIRERVPGTLGEGSAATTGQLEADLRTRWVRKGMFGISLPIGQIKDAIKSN